MEDHRTPKEGLPRFVQMALGEQLREAYSSFVRRLPWDLINLARRITTPISESPRASPIVETLGSKVNETVFDPATIAILDAAFEKAWDDLQSLHNPVSRETLALHLMALVKGERHPSRLASKAVLTLIVPPPTKANFPTVFS
jgi:hypothetical protein